jgi:hypothetical protein
VRPPESSTFPLSGFTPSLFATATTSEANLGPLQPTAQYAASVPGIDRNTLASYGSGSSGGSTESSRRRET